MVNLSFDITSFVWNFDRQNEMIKRGVQEIDHNLCKHYSNAEETELWEKLFSLIKKDDVDVQILSMTDVIVHMWKNNEGMDIEMNDVQDYLDETLKRWGETISASLKYAGAWDESKGEDFFANFYKWKDDIFEFVEKSYKIDEKYVKKVSTPAD